MSNFQAKMRQNRFRLWLRPRPRWGELTAFPDPIAGVKETYFERKGRVQGGEWRGEGGKSWGGDGRRGGRTEREGKRVEKTLLCIFKFSLQ